jgi:hypothetical protein
MIVGGFGVVILLGWAGVNLPSALLFFHSPRLVSDRAGVATILVIMVAMAALYGFVVWGGLQMRRQENWTAAMAASLIVMIPSVCFVVGLPIGIWSMRVLLKPQVRGAFAA